MVGTLVYITALFAIYLAVFTYLADTYGIYASSALAGQSLCSKFSLLVLYSITCPDWPHFFRESHGHSFPLIHGSGWLWIFEQGSHASLKPSQMYDGLTFRWASTLFGIFAAVLAIVPFILFAYGPQIRARSRFAQKLAQNETGVGEAGEAEVMAESHALESGLDIW